MPRLAAHYEASRCGGAGADAAVMPSAGVASLCTGPCCLWAGTHVRCVATWVTAPHALCVHHSSGGVSLTLPPSSVCCCRYSRGGPLLWPKAQAPQPQPCPSCGGPRVFEVQLMPALSQVVLEAAGMAAEQGIAVDADGEIIC